MIAQKYIDQMKLLVRKVFPKHSVFVFGSSLREDVFGDVDIAIEGEISLKEMFRLEHIFYDSCFPYKTDIVAFDQADQAFRTYVLENEQKKWI